MENFDRAKIENITSEFLSVIKLPRENAKKLNYLMVIPILINDNDSQYAFPLGFASVVSALKASGRQVFTLNLNYKDEPIETLRRVIRENCIDVVMTTGFCINFWSVKDITDTTKEVDSNIVTVVGGGIISGDPIAAMKALETADYGAIGEGEISVNALAYALETENGVVEVDGFICKKNDEWKVCGEFQEVPNINFLPFPDYEGLEYNLLLSKSKPFLIFKRKNPLSNEISINTSRSCTHNCTFCFHTCGRKYKRLSMDNIFKLIDWLLLLYPNTDAIFIVDELAFGNHNFAIEFCRRIKPYNLLWKAILRIDNLNKEALINMKDSGCYLAIIGIESADKDVLKSMRKGITIKQVENALDIGNEISLPLEGGLIFGDVVETKERAWNSINWWFKYRNVGYSVVRMWFICIYPGTELYKIACKREIIKDRVQFLKDGCPLINVSKMSDDYYYMFPRVLHLLQLEGKLLDGVLTPKHDLTVDIHGICPHCKKGIDFIGLDTLFDTNPRPCPACGSNVIVNAIEYCDAEKLNEKIKSIVSENGLALWAITTINYFWLLRMAPSLLEDNVMFINSNELKAPWCNVTIKTLEEKEVVMPEKIASTNINVVLSPNTPKICQNIKEQCEREFAQIKRVIHITELL